MNPAPSIPPRPGVADFGRTRWSVVVAVRSGSEADARESLAELCRRYWVPVYAYVRRSGHAPDSAAALVQAFLSLLVHEIRAGDPAADGGFRVFLQRRLESFLGGDRARLTGVATRPELAPPWPLEEIEQRLQRNELAELSPTHAFQRAFALELLAHGLEQLRLEAGRHGRDAMFQAVRPFLTREPTPGEYAELTATLQCSPLATVIAVKRLRQRFQELIDAQLVQTVGGPEAFEAERSALLGLLVPPRP